MTAAASEPAPPDVVAFSGEGWDIEAHQWRRYGARMIDTILFELPIFPLLMLLLMLSPEAAFGWMNWPFFLVYNFLLQPISFGMTGIGTALCVARWGRTPGKWLFGLKVLGANGEKLTIRRAFARELNLFWWGVGLGVTALTLFQMIRSYSEVDTKDRSRWDVKSDSNVFARPLEGRVYIGVVIGAGLIVLYKSLSLFTELNI